MAKNETQLIQLFFEQWKSDKYAAKVKNRSLYYFIAEKVYRLSRDPDTNVSVSFEEEFFSLQEEGDTRIILHCLNISRSLPETQSTIVRSPDTDVLVLLAKYCKDIQHKILFDTGLGNKCHLLCVHDCP